MAEVVGRLRSMAAGGPEHSIGIVTCNPEQQALIETLLGEARRDDPSLERFFSDDLHEPTMVKNLGDMQARSAMPSFSRWPTPEYRIAQRKMREADAQTEAIEDLILATPAASLADAVAQIMLATTKVVANAINGDGAEDQLLKAECGLRSALFAVAAASGVMAEQMRFADYLPDFMLPGPEGGRA